MVPLVANILSVDQHRERFCWEEWSVSYLDAISLKGPVLVNLFSGQAHVSANTCFSGAGKVPGLRYGFRDTRGTRCPAGVWSGGSVNKRVTPSLESLSLCHPVSPCAAAELPGVCLEHTVLCNAAVGDSYVFWAHGLYSCVPASAKN